MAAGDILERERVKVKRTFQPGEVFRLRLRHVNPEQILALDVNRCLAQFGRGEDADTAIPGVGAARPTANEGDHSGARLRSEVSASIMGEIMALFGRPGFLRGYAVSRRYPRPCSARIAVFSPAVAILARTRATKTLRSWSVAPFSVPHTRRISVARLTT